MPSVFPFRAVQYARTKAGSTDLSKLVAPPYDVLDAHKKAALLAKDPRNVVSIDLPHLPAKELGPPETYQKAGATFRAWLKDGTMARAAKPVMFAYRETFKTGPQTFQRTGMACTVETVPFGPRKGGGILPHEETFSGPKEDRLALMKSAAAQFSPIFGLHPDESGRATAVLTQVCAARPADITADMGDGVKHEVWTIDDAATIRAYADALASEDIFIADGHHRYNTALNYLKLLETQSGKPVGPDHPARRCLMVLVGMNDPGMVIWPTHRVLGGMKSYSLDSFLSATKQHLKIHPHSGDLHSLDRSLASITGPGQIGLYDFASRKCFLASPAAADPLASKFPTKPQAWRELDVALCQYVVVEQICQPALNSGQPVQWAFPHTIQEVLDIGSGKEMGSGGGKSFVPQLGVILRPTPLEAVRAVSRAGELMPQKSTFFYPKLATGLFINDVGA